MEIRYYVENALGMVTLFAPAFWLFLRTIAPVEEQLAQVANRSYAVAHERIGSSRAVRTPPRWRCGLTTAIPKAAMPA